MADTETPEEYSQKWWVAKIEAQEKTLDEKWRNSADRIVKRYLDDRGDNQEGGPGGDEGGCKYNVFWANVQILKSALYATPPKPMVTRQNADASDDVARCAAMMLERILSISVNEEGSDMHEAFQMGVEDRLIPGLGNVWLRYDVTTEEKTLPAITDPRTNQLLPAAQVKVITDEDVCTDYVHWRDFLWSPARTWREVWWVARRLWLRKSKFVSKFGQPKWDEVKENYTRVKDKEQYPKGFLDNKAEVFELWCKDTNKRYYICRHSETILETTPDPLKLDNFFPCPKPLLSTHTTNSLVPRPDFTMVQDQYHELDVLNDRISIITQALRVVGVYDATNKSLKELLTGPEFQMVPIDNWAVYSEKGGMKGNIDWFPIEVIATVLGQLVIQRQSVIAQIYELTSISDIMRGASNPRETLGAQKLKSQYSSVRLQLTQQDVGLWVRDSMRIKAEIVAKHCSAEMIFRESQVQYTNSKDLAPAAIKLIKDYKASEYRINVNEETLSIADYNAERELRTEYITAVGQFMSQAAMMIEKEPDAMPFLLKMVQWVTASFRGSADIESVLDQMVQAAEEKAKQPKPDPAAQAAQADAAKEQAKAQAKGQADAQKAGIEAQRDVAIEQQRTQQKEIDAGLKREEIASRERIAEQNNSTKLLIEQMQQQLDGALAGMADDRQANQQGMELMIERMRMAMEAMQDQQNQQHEARMAESDQRHQQGMSKLEAKLTPKPEKEQEGADIKQILQKIMEHSEQAAQPRTLVRGPDGKATHIQQGSRRVPIQRDENGKLLGA